MRDKIHFLPPILYPAYHTFTTTMASVDSNSNKRRRTTAAAGICLADLQIGILEHVASFLAAPSRILFAVALTTDEDNPPSNNRYSSISGTGSDWESLNFGDIEKDLATKLSDDDISDVLQHIDAVNNVKRLRLTNCTKITGVGLEPLRGSTIIEQIDLSLKAIGEAAMNLWMYDPPISSDEVLPILDSIIASDGCSLKHLQFPCRWRRNIDIYSDFHAFIVRYCVMRGSRDTMKCLYCKKDIPPVGGHWIGRDDEALDETSIKDDYGLHNYHCYQCTKHYCYDCDGPDLSCCDNCQRDYCKDCVEVYECGKCDDLACEHCSKKCNNCHQTICSECIENDRVYFCAYCGGSHCVDCNNQGNNENPIRFCKQCSKYGCNSCRLRMYQEGGIDCVDCMKLLPNEVFLQLIEQSARLKQEVEELKNENKELKLEREEVEQLKHENKELKLQIKELREP